MEKTFCRECGAEIPSDAKFCSNCGTRVLSASQDSIEENQRSTTQDKEVEDRTSLPHKSAPKVIYKVKYDDTNGSNRSEKQKDNTKRDRVLSKVKLPNRIGRIVSIIALALAILFLIISLLSGKMAGIIFSIVQLVCAIIAYFMHNEGKKKDANSYLK